MERQNKIMGLGRFNCWKLHIIGAVISFVALSVTDTLASAAEKPACDSGVVTRNCQFFKEHSSQVQITLKDGTSYPNPMYQPPTSQLVSGADSGQSPSMQGGYGVAGGYGFGLNPLDMQAQMEKMQDEQAQILAALEGVKISPKTKLSLSSSLGGILANPQLTYRVPLPMDSPNPQMATLPGTQVLKLLEARLGPEVYKTVVASAAAQKGDVENRAKQMQEQQLAIMKSQERMQEQAQLQTVQRNKRTKRIVELFQYAQDSLIKIIKRGRSNQDLTPEQKRLIRKISDVRLGNLDDPSLQSNSYCAGGAMNATYSPTEGQVILCPASQGLPDSSVLFMLGHELGHAIDPCNFGMGSWTVDGSAVDKYVNTHPIDPSDVQSLKAMSTTGQYDYDPYRLIDNRKTLGELQTIGALKQTLPNLSQEKYPFSNELRCMQDKNKFLGVTEKDLKEKEKYLRARIVQLNGSPESAKKVMDRYQEDAKKHPQCFSPKGHQSQSQEMMSDVMGALTLEKYLQEYPPQTEEEKVGAIYFAHGNCLNKSNFTDSVSPYTINQALRAWDGEHPINNMRVARVILNLPSMATQYGCQRTAVACFDHLSQASKSAGSAADSVGPVPSNASGGVK